MKEIHKAYKYRLYPTKEQTILLNKHIGCCRFIYNYFLDLKKTEYETANKNLSRFDMQKLLTSLKKDINYNWLPEVNSQSLQCALQNLDSAYLRFFKKISQFPRFKSKRNGGSFKIPFQLIRKQYHTIYTKNNIAYLPKFKEGIKFDNHRPINGKIISISISKTPTGKFYISFTCKTSIKQLEQRTESIGIDLGLKTFAVTNDNETVDNPKFLRKKLKKIKYLSKQHSKKQSKSSNKEKARLKLAKQYEKVTNQRTNFLHQTSKKLINENQVICLEDLAVKNMMQNHNLALSISDVSWSKFVNQLCYKADWYGRQIVFINRFYPSSKTCNNCGWINQDLTLDIREWTCPNCNIKHDRNLNAAINIHNVGMNWFNQETKNKTVSGTDSVFKQKPPKALSVDKSMKVEAMSFRS